MCTATLPVIPCRPAIADGAEASIGCRLAYRDSLNNWKRQFGPIPARSLPAKMRGRPQKVDSSPQRYTFVGETNHRRPGSHGALFIDWLIRNPGVRSRNIRDAGFDMKHLKWDLEKNPTLIKVE